MFSVFLFFLTGLSVFAQDAELKRTLHKASFLMPYEKKISTLETALIKLEKDSFSQMPAILYMHGCAGIGYYERKDLLNLASLGFLVVAPDSFARENKPQSCDAKAAKGGMHREVLNFRIAEAKYALDWMSKQSFIRGDSIQMVGFSEGGITTAVFQDSRLVSKLVLGWSCHSGWEEYRGVNLKPKQRFLSIVASQDPWFQVDYLTGSCHRFVPGNKKAQGVVLAYDKHWVSEHPYAKTLIKNFLMEELGAGE